MFLLFPDEHCNAEYVKDFFKKYIDDKETGIVADWCCRLFSEHDMEQNA